MPLNHRSPYGLVGLLQIVSILLQFLFSMLGLVVFSQSYYPERYDLSIYINSFYDYLLEAQTSFFMCLLGIYFCLNKVDFLDQEALKDSDKTKTNVLLLTLQTAFSSNP